jgi:hypothetical protein
MCEELAIAVSATGFTAALAVLLFELPRVLGLRFWLPTGSALAHPGGWDERFAPTSGADADKLGGGGSAS